MDRHEAARQSAREIGRRRALIGGSALAGLALSAALPATAGATDTLRGHNPFTLGVASGDPSPQGVVLWTRLAPVPLAADGGLPPYPLPVRWRVTSDDQLRHTVRQGWAIARPRLAHSVHVEVQGLEPDRWYWYQFSLGDWHSPIGRTRTLPRPDQASERLRFAFVSCQDYQNGLYPAFRGLAAESLDLVVHLGDYIYEGPADPSKPRQHNGPELESLASYRQRYALYKLDPHLQAAHAAFPWLVTWDDHEVDNDYAGANPEDNSDPERFLVRRANAYQAYYEHQPLRRSSLPQGPNLRLYRRFAFGQLAELSVLDTRQYRSDQPCGAGDFPAPECPARLDPNQTMTGPEQERWLLEGLDRSTARWNVIAQQTMMAEFKIPAAIIAPGAPGNLFIMDQWDGYVAARNRILGFLHHRRPANPIVITGDIHSSWVQDLKADFANPASPTVATEFVGTSISSDFPAPLIPLAQAAIALANPHTRFFDGALRGYVRCTLDARTWRTDFRVVDSILTDQSPVRTLASFVVENGRPGAVRA